LNSSDNTLTVCGTSVVAHKGKVCHL